MVVQEVLCVLAALAHLLTFVGKPCAGLLCNSHLHCQVEQCAFAANALAVHDVELCLTEWWSNFVLHHFDAST